MSSWGINSLHRFGAPMENYSSGDEYVDHRPMAVFYRQHNYCYTVDDFRLINDVEVRYTGVSTLECLHPETRQRVLIVGYAGGSNGMDHVHVDVTPGMYGMRSVISQFLFGNSRCVAIVEGRIPPAVYEGVYYPGERYPEIDAANVQDAILKHGGAGLLTALVRQGGGEIISSDDDRGIISEMMHEGYPLEDLRRYLLFRQIPQWARTTSDARPPLGDYLQSNVIERFSSLMGDAWDTFDFSLYAIMGMDITTLNEVGIDMPQEVVDAFLEEAVGVTFTTYTTLTRTQKVSLRFNQLRSEHFFDLLFEGWGEQGTPDKIAETGTSNIHAIAGQIGKRLGLYPYKEDLNPRYPINNYEGMTLREIMKLPASEM